MSGYIPRTHWMVIAIRVAFPFDSLPNDAWENAARVQSQPLLMESSCFATLDEAQVVVQTIPHEHPYKVAAVVACACAALVPSVGRERVN